MKQQLRQYQIDAVAQTRSEFAKCKGVLLVCPTGGGKTTVAADIIERLEAKGNRALFLAHRKELIDQCSARLDQHGIDHGIIKAGNKRVNNRPIQVASVQTLIRRVGPKEKDGEVLVDYRPKVDLIIIDEAHRALANSYKKVLECWPDAKVLGLTATPVRADGRGLGDLFDSIVLASTPAELTEAGYLVPARVFTSVTTPDFSKVHTTKGDFDQEEVEALVDKAVVIGDIYKHWKERAGDRQTVIFAASVKHGQHINEEFTARGETAEFLDGTTSDEDREAILERMKKRETRIIVNVGVLTEGWDNPEIGCVVIARPTQSLSLYLQMGGRALRPAPWISKIDCIILDHGGNTARHGFVIDDREWSLEGAKKKSKAAIPTITTCPKCFALSSKAKVCPECGFSFEQMRQDAQGREVKQEDGELQEVNPAIVRMKERDFFVECLRQQDLSGYRPSYAVMKFKDKFGRFPGKEIGLKTEWAYDKSEDGKRRYKPSGYVFNGRSIPFGGGDPSQDPAPPWGSPRVENMAGQYW